jgi:hypothetical protein
MNQPAVAKLEKLGDMHVSNLRRCIEALGGTLEITAHFDMATVIVSDIGELRHQPWRRATIRGLEKPDLGTTRLNLKQKICIS